MQSIHDPEVRRYRAKAAVLQAAVLLAVITGLVAIGTAAPERQYLTMNCAVDPGALDTASDALLELSSACPGVADAAPARAASGTKYGVPDAKSALDPRAEPETQPITF